MFYSYNFNYKTTNSFKIAFFINNWFIQSFMWTYCFFLSSVAILNLISVNICGYVLWNVAADCKPKNSITSLSSFTAMFMWTFLFSDNAQTTFNAWQLTWPAWGLRPGLCYLWDAAGTDLQAWYCPIQTPLSQGAATPVTISAAMAAVLALASASLELVHNWQLAWALERLDCPRCVFVTWGSAKCLPPYLSLSPSPPKFFIPLNWDIMR